MAADDTTAPTLVSAEAKSQNKVILTFSEPVDAATLDTNVYHTAETAAYKASSVKEVPGSNGTQYEVTFANPIPAGNATFLVSKEAAKDNFGNKNESVLKVTAPVAVDTVKPTVSEFKYVDTTKAEITFSEEVTGADVRGNYKITDKDGKAVTGFTVSGYNDKDKKVTLTFSPALKEGEKYTIEITGIKDKAVVPNEMDKYTNTFTATDVTGPIIQNTGVYNKTDRTITVFFNEPVDGTTALDKSKYTLQYGDKELALPSDASITLGGNNTSVTINLPATVKDSTGTDISDSIDGVVVGQLQDLAGNKSKTFTEVGFSTPDPLNDSNIISGSAKTVDTRTVQFEVNTPLKSIVADDFTVNGKPVEFATFENKTLSDGSYGAVVTLKVADRDKWRTDATPAIATTDTIDTVSLYGNKFATSTNLATAKDGIAPAVAKTTDDPSVDNVLVQDNKLDNGSDGQDGIADTIVMTFTEDLKPSTVSVDDFKVAGYEVKDLSVDGNTVTLQVEQAKSPNLTDTFAVSLVGNISDKADNVLAADASKEYKTIAVVVPSAPKATLDVATGATTGTFTTQEYSVDGGNTWTTFSTDNAILSPTVLASLDPTKDFKVRVKATNTAPAGEVQTIDLTKAATPSASDVTISKGTTTGKVGVKVANTLEYRVVGADGTELQSWTTGTGVAVDTTASVNAGDKIEVRVKASGTVLPSDAYTYTIQSSDIGE